MLSTKQIIGRVVFGFILGIPFWVVIAIFMAGFGL